MRSAQSEQCDYISDRAKMYAEIAETKVLIKNYKDSKTGEWNKPTFADCTAFGETAKRILKEYKAKDEIWLIAKYYSKQQDGKYYKGFIVREIITEQEIQRGARAGNSRLKCSEKCSTNAREDGNFETFDNDLPF